MIYGLEPLRCGTFCKSKIVCAEIKGEYVLCFKLYRCRRATGKGRLCFINRKGKTFISDIRVFVMENACFFRIENGLSEKWWTFFRFFSCFVCNLTPFFEKSRSFLFVLFATVPHACERA